MTQEDNKPAETWRGQRMPPSVSRLFDKPWIARKQKGMIAGWPIWYIQTDEDPPRDIASTSGISGGMVANRIVNDHAKAMLLTVNEIPAANGMPTMIQHFFAGFSVSLHPKTDYLRESACPICALTEAEGDA